MVRALLAVALAGALAAPAQTQVPEGWYVVASLKPQGTTSGVGGLFLVHPETPGTPIIVTGLNHELTGAGPLEPKGANSVLIRPSDGALVVGERGPTRTNIDLHLIHLSVSTTAGRPTAASVVSDVKYRLGSSGGSTPYVANAIGQCAWLPDGRVLVPVWGLTTGPLGGRSLAIVDLDSGVITPVSTGGQSIGSDAMCLDPSGTTAWLCRHTVVSPIVYTLYSVPVPSGGPPTAHGTVRGSHIFNLAYDAGRGLIVGTAEADESLVEFDAATGAFVRKVPTPFGPNYGLRIEDVTGQYVVGSWPLSPGPSVCKMTPDVASSSLLAGIPGYPIGIDMLATPGTYGTGTSGASSYTWSLDPNPGGLPTIGNAGFALQVAASPGPIPATSFYLVSLGQASINTLGITVLVDPSPAQKLSGGLLAPTGLIPLAIPPDPSLVGMQGFGQSLHRETGGWAASDGVAFTLL